MKNINMLVFPGVEMLQKPILKLPIVEDNINIEGIFCLFYFTFHKAWKVFIISMAHANSSG